LLKKSKRYNRLAPWSLTFAAKQDQNQNSSLWSSVWGGNKPLNSESLHVYIYRLRAKLAEFELQIETMVNVGYRLITSKSQ